jgi:hypothetical protein
MGSGIRIAQQVDWLTSGPESRQHAQTCQYFWPELSNRRVKLGESLPNQRRIRAARG